MQKSPYDTRGRIDWWTPERVHLLREMWEKGEPLAIIAQQLETTPNAVSGKACRLMLGTHPNYSGKYHGGYATKRLSDDDREARIRASVAFAENITDRAFLVRRLDEARVEIERLKGKP